MHQSTIIKIRKTAKVSKIVIIYVISLFSSLERQLCMLTLPTKPVIERCSGKWAALEILNSFHDIPGQMKILYAFNLNRVSTEIANWLLNSMQNP